MDTGFIRAIGVLVLGITAWVLPSHAAERVLRIGTPEGLPGYSMSAAGQLVIDVAPRRQLFACIEKSLQARFIWEALPTRRVLRGVVDGQLDMAFPMGFTAERDASMLQSAATWTNPDVWLSLRPVRIDDKSLRLAARLGSPQEVEPAAEGYARVIGSATYPELAKTLAMGMVDAVIVPRSIYEQQANLWPQGTVVMAGRQRSSGFYLQQGDPKGLLAPLNRAIDSCRHAVK